MLTVGVTDGLFYVISFMRSTEAQPPTFWIVQGGFIDPNVTPERRPLTVSGDRISAAVPVKLLDGLPPSFGFQGRCSREVQTPTHDKDSFSEDVIFQPKTEFKGKV
jgi:hypothetical protein